MGTPQYPRASLRPLNADVSARLFASLFGEVQTTGVPAGKLKFGRTQRVEGVADWSGSPLIAGNDEHGRRYIAVETETHEYLYRDDQPERIIDFASWYVVSELEPDVSEDGSAIVGTYGDRDLTRQGPVEILNMRQVLLGEPVLFRTETDAFIEVRASRRYLDGVDTQ